MLEKARAISISTLANECKKREYMGIDYICSDIGFREENFTHLLSKIEPEDFLQKINKHPSIRPPMYINKKNNLG